MAKDNAWVIYILIAQFTTAKQRCFIDESTQWMPSSWFQFAKCRCTCHTWICQVNDFSLLLTPSSNNQYMAKCCKWKRKLFSGIWKLMRCLEYYTLKKFQKDLNNNSPRMMDTDSTTNNSYFFTERSCLLKPRDVYIVNFFSWSLEAVMQSLELFTVSLILHLHSIQNKDWFNIGIYIMGQIMYKSIPR